MHDCIFLGQKVLKRILDYSIMGNGNHGNDEDDPQRVKRPVERQKMGPWLLGLLDTDEVPGLSWENKKEKTFKINWKHGSRHGYNANRDASLFEKYAELTGILVDSIFC